MRGCVSPKSSSQAFIDRRTEKRLTTESTRYYADCAARYEVGPSTHKRHHMRSTMRGAFAFSTVERCARFLGCVFAQPQLVCAHFAERRFRKERMKTRLRRINTSQALDFHLVQTITLYAGHT